MSREPSLVTRTATFAAREPVLAPRTSSLVVREATLATRMASLVMREASSAARAVIFMTAGRPVPPTESLPMIQVFSIVSGTMDHERMAAELAGALRSLMAIEQAKTYGKRWNGSWIHARAILSRYDASGPDVATELLIACRRLLYWATPAETRALPEAWQAAIGDLRQAVESVEDSILALVGVSEGSRRR